MGLVNSALLILWECRVIFRKKAKLEGCASHFKSCKESFIWELNLLQILLLILPILGVEQSSTNFCAPLHSAFVLKNYRILLSAAYFLYSDCVWTSKKDNIKCVKVNDVKNCILLEMLLFYCIVRCYTQDKFICETKNKIPRN